MGLLPNHGVGLYLSGGTQAERFDLIPFGFITLGAGGLPRCARCPSSGPGLAFGESAEIRTQIDEAVAGWVGVPGPNLVFGAAESFAHPELPALVAYAVRAGVERLALETGGGSLTTGENAAGALHVGVRHIIVHYVPRAAPVPDAAESMDTEMLALSGIRAFRRAADGRGVKVAISAVIPVCRHTGPYLPAAVADLADAGVGAVSLAGGGGVVEGSALLAQVTAACDTGVVNGVWVDVSGIDLPFSHSAHAAGGDAR